MRTLEEQVEPELAKKFRVATEGLLALRPAGRASSYYIFEISRAVDSGMFLSTVMLGSALLEIWLRDLLVIRKATRDLSRSKRELRYRIAKIDREIEGEKHGLGFSQITNQLFDLDVINESEKESLKNLFSKYRNPLMHGISGRFIGRWGEQKPSEEMELSPESMFLRTMFDGVHNRSERLEDTLDQEACEHLEYVLNFIAAHPLPSGL